MLTIHCRPTWSTIYMPEHYQRNSLLKKTDFSTGVSKRSRSALTLPPFLLKKNRTEKVDVTGRVFAPLRNHGMSQFIFLAPTPTVGNIIFYTGRVPKTISLEHFVGRLGTRHIPTQYCTIPCRLVKGGNTLNSISSKQAPA